MTQRGYNEHVSTVFDTPISQTGTADVFALVITLVSHASGVLLLHAHVIQLAYRAGSAPLCARSGPSLRSRTLILCSDCCTLLPLGIRYDWPNWYGLR